MNKYYIIFDDEELYLNDFKIKQIKYFKCLTHYNSSNKINITDTLLIHLSDIFCVLILPKSWYQYILNIIKIIMYYPNVNDITNTFSDKKSFYIFFALLDFFQVKDDILENICLNKIFLNQFLSIMEIDYDVNMINDNILFSNTINILLDKLDFNNYDKIFQFLSFILYHVNIFYNDTQRHIVYNILDNLSDKIILKKITTTIKILIKNYVENYKQPRISLNIIDNQYDYFEIVIRTKKIKNCFSIKMKQMKKFYLDLLDNDNAKYLKIDEYDYGTYFQIRKIKKIDGEKLRFEYNNMNMGTINRFDLDINEYILNKLNYMVNIEFDKFL